MQINTKLFGRFAVVAVAALAFNAAVVPAAQAGNHAPLGYQLLCLKHPNASECKGGGAAKVTVTGDAVSYTHLDVYKRQREDSPDPMDSSRCT